jgi:hypothetical protein
MAALCDSPETCMRFWMFKQWCQPMLHRPVQKVAGLVGGSHRILSSRMAGLLVDCYRILLSHISYLFDVTAADILHSTRQVGA